MAKSSTSKTSQADEQTANPGAGTAQAGAAAQTQAGAQAQSGQGMARPTMPHLLGEMTWLMMQSPHYRRFPIAELEWFVVPPLRLEQFRIFRGNPTVEGRDGKQRVQELVPVGAALWAMLSKEVERRLTDSVQAGEGPVKMKPQDWNSGNRLWLIDLIAPFATEENNQIQVMMTDFLQRGLTYALPKARNNAVKYHRRDPESGKVDVVELRPGESS